MVNLKNETYTRYIGRSGDFGNPFIIGPFCTRAESIERHRQWLLKWLQHQEEVVIGIYSNRWVIEHLEELRGEVLGCYCKPLACHGDVLVELLEEKG